MVEDHSSEYVEDGGVASIERGVDDTRLGPSEGQAPLLLERDRQLEQLTAGLNDADSGIGRVALIEGPAGIGKTRLMQAACEKALVSGFTVRVARATELDREYPLGLVRQIFEPLLAALAPDERAAYLTGAAAGAEAVFDPSAHDDLPPDPGFGRLHALYWLTANLADESPLLLAFDDLQWGDPASRRFVSFLAARLDGLRVFLLVTSRPGEPGTPEEIPRELSSGPDLVRVMPLPLSSGAVATAVRAEIGEHVTDDLCLACAKTSGGNPFYLSQLLMALPAHMPEEGGDEDLRSLQPHRIGKVVLARVAECGQHALDVARAITVLGDNAEPADLSTLTGLDVRAVGESSCLLEEASILDQVQPARFAHPVIRAVVARSIPLEDLSSAHLRAARLALRRGSVDGAAAHLVLVSPGEESWISESLLDAARQTLGRGEPDLARVFLRRALEEGSLEPALEYSIRLEQGRLDLTAGRPEAIDRLREVWMNAPLAELRGLAACELAMALAVNKRGGEMVEVARAALEEFGGQESLITQRLHGILLVGACHTIETRRLTREAAAQAARLAEPGGPPVLLAHAALERAFAEGKVALASTLAEDALRNGLVGIAGLEAPAPYLALLIRMAQDRYRDAEVLAAEMLQMGQGRGSSVAIAIASAFRALARVGSGDLLGAEADARMAIEFSPPHNQARPLGAAAGITGALARGRLEQAAEFDQAFDPAAMESGVFVAQPFMQARGELALARGDFLEVERIAGDLASWEAGFGFRPEAWVQWRPLAAAAVASKGRREEARSMLEEAIEHARAQGSRRTLSRALLAHARVADDTPIEELEESVTVLEGLEMPFDTAKAKIALGKAKREAGDGEGARVDLASGLELAAACCADGLVADASEELVAAGARPRRVAISGAAALTPAERRVAELAAAGNSNPEIAQALFVTRKTVETHMGSIFRKLDISSRFALASRLELEED